MQSFYGILGRNKERESSDKYEKRKKTDTMGTVFVYWVSDCISFMYGISCCTAEKGHRKQTAVSRIIGDSP